MATIAVIGSSEVMPVISPSGGFHRCGMLGMGSAQRVVAPLGAFIAGMGG